MKVGYARNELTVAIEQVYRPAGINIMNAYSETESAEYKACRFSIDDKMAVFRVAKTTPTKIGQFVTMWKRTETRSDIQPLDAADGVDFVVVSVADEAHRGQFLFSKEILISQSIMSCEDKKGKLAIRVYPPWTKPTVKQAIMTQRWQLRCFFSIQSDGIADTMRVRELFKLGALEYSSESQKKD